MPVTELPISRADHANADVRRHAPQERYWISSAPSRRERFDVGQEIDRWNNEGGFVPDDDAGLGSSLRHDDGDRVAASRLSL